MTFRHNEAVEVCQRRTGFRADAYYLQATFMASMGGTHSLVRYHNRYADDEMQNLRIELILNDLVRPVPQINPSINYALYQKVDAFDDGAWWVGRVSAVHPRQSPGDPPAFSVRLDINGHDYTFPFFRLRNHLDWRDGQWVQPGPSRAPRPRSER